MHMKENAGSFNAEKVGRHRCLLGEGPVWDEAHHAIHWIDVLRGDIHEYSYITGVEKTISVGEMVGSIAFCTDGNFIAGLEKGIHFIERGSGSKKHIASPESHLADNRSNDGKVDPAGRFWLGTMSKTEAAHAGALYMVDKNLKVIQKVSGTTISNGMAWSPDKKQFYFIDSTTRGVDAFDYEDATGEISNKRLAVSFSEADGFPDGMTIDSEGMLWIAQWDGWQVSRWNPVTGKKLLSVSLPVSRPTCCIFGGEQLSDLFITTASTGLSPEEVEQQPEAGALFVIRNTGFRGLPANKFEV